MRIDAIIEGVIGREGGYTNNPADPGGATMWGVTERVARANGYTGPMNALPRDKAKDIYFQQYVAKPGFAAINAVAPTIAEKLIDIGVNMGTSVAAMFLQRALNALNSGGAHYPDLKEDGDAGPATLAALKAYLAKRGNDGESVLFKAINGQQIARYLDIARGRPASEAFVYGWLRTRAA